jgi:serine/threonine protein kinase
VRSASDALVGPIEQQLIDGRYTVIERLGKGAMGVVYKAHDAVLDRQVAVKAMVAEIDDDPQLRQRFSQEARAAARLNHRNIITIYELHESDNQLYIVMELLEGVDLATLMKRQVGLPLEAKLNMIAQVCDGLDYAHRKGIIHRDIKPANLHVSPAGTVKILDFGIARLAQSKMTTTGGLVGTPDYMSPEQVMAGSLDARSDLFAVGAVMYELLSGSKPFEADSVTALLMKIVRDPHVPLRERAPHLPDAAILLVERLLQKDPNHRPSTAQEVQSALLSIATDRPPLDAATVSILATAVTAETMRPKTPSPPSRTGGSGTARKQSGASSAVRRPASDSSSRLASLAIERGRALREAGDLAGAMKVFRSVLEIAPGNAEALGELEEMERAFARITSSGRIAAAAPPAAPVQETPPAPAAQPPAPQYATPTILKPGREVTVPPAAVPPPPPPAPAKSPVLPPPAPVAGRRPVAPVSRKGRPGSQGIALLAVAAIALMAIGAGAVYMIVAKFGNKAQDQAAQTSVTTTSVLEQAALTTSSVAPPPEVVVPPVTSSVPETTVVAPTTSSVVAAVTSQPGTPVRPTRPASTSVRVPTTDTAPGVSTSVPVVVASSSVPPPPPTTSEPAPPAGPPSVMVRHNHARALFRGGGYCEGPLQLLPDGIYFKTSGSSDGRQDEKKITFASIDGFEIDGDKIHIETDDKNWDFVAPKDVLLRIEALLKANVKK